MTTDTIINQLLDTKRIQQVSQIERQYSDPYYSLQINSGNDQIDCLIDEQYLKYFLLPFEVTSIGNFRYIRIIFDDKHKTYLHSLVKPAPAGYVTHHSHLDTFDNRENSLMVLPKGEHSRFHRNLKFTNCNLGCIYHGHDPLLSISTKSTSSRVGVSL